MQLQTLTAISPLDGRYRKRLELLSTHASEYGLIKYRVQVEIAWFLFLASNEEIPELESFTPSTVQQIHSIANDFSISEAEAIQNIEKTTNHDVKAVEYFIKDKLTALGLSKQKEFVHFGCTSEDINNLSYGLMLQAIRSEVLVPKMLELTTSINEISTSLRDIPMLSRTHGQTASPTTVGKELANFVNRLRSWREKFESVLILGKMNGAVGNYNAHTVAYPDIDWLQFSTRFVHQIGLNPNEMTTQIEPHDYITSYFDSINGFNQVLIDFSRDIWGYISIGYFKQRSKKGETGSSTMPHKVNPIDFENAEGNLGMANALSSHVGSKLTVSRWQRDLSDSTVLRSIGTCIGYSLVAYSSISRGIPKLEMNRDRIESDLNNAWEVLSEAIQTVLRKNGVDEPYEKIKDLTRGLQFDKDSYQTLLQKLRLTDTTFKQLSALSPQTYVGLASQLARRENEKND